LFLKFRAACLSECERKRLLLLLAICILRPFSDGWGANVSDTELQMVFMLQLWSMVSFVFSRCTISDCRGTLVFTVLRKEVVATSFIIGSWRGLDNLTPHDNHHSSRIMRTYHTHYGVPLGISPGWWDDRKRNHKPVLPIYFCLDISNNLSRALSCLRLSGHNFPVQRMRHNRNRRPYELRICDKCDWHYAQDEEHILLDCPHEHLVRLRTQHRQLVFPPQI